MLPLLLAAIPITKKISKGGNDLKVLSYPVNKPVEMAACLLVFQKLFALMTEIKTSSLPLEDSLC